MVKTTVKIKKPKKAADTGNRNSKLPLQDCFSLVRVGLNTRTRSNDKFEKFD